MMTRVSADRPDDGDDVVGALRQLGIPAEAIERAVQSGDPERAIFEAVLMPAVASRDPLDRLAAVQGVGGDRLPGAVEVTVLFCDLKDFTAYADLAGDAAAVDAIDQLTGIVMRERGERVWLSTIGSPLAR
jgi:hypothetical protein